ncbi:hypothetical protein EDD21DRAFT_409658 [Dissophora ornata]|nr:hypothetical protein EDD21DRAFT_409658 [Dissophora ornata]
MTGSSGECMKYFDRVGKVVWFHQELEEAQPRLKLSLINIPVKDIQESHIEFDFMTLWHMSAILLFLSDNFIRLGTFFDECVDLFFECDNLICQRFDFLDQVTLDRLLRSFCIVVIFTFVLTMGGGGGQRVVCLIFVVFLRSDPGKENQRQESSNVVGHGPTDGYMSNDAQVLDLCDAAPRFHLEAIVPRIFRMLYYQVIHLCQICLASPNGKAQRTIVVKK